MFNYGSGHTVDEVSESHYNTCTTGNALTTDSSGGTNITLKTAGAHYFICGAVGHCGNGMKLAVTVTEGSTSSGNASSTPTTTSGRNNHHSNNVNESSSGAALSPFFTVVFTFVAFF